MATKSLLDHYNANTEEYTIYGGANSLTQNLRKFKELGYTVEYLLSCGLTVKCIRQYIFRYKHYESESLEEFVLRAKDGARKSAAVYKNKKRINRINELPKPLVDLVNNIARFKSEIEVFKENHYMEFSKISGLINQYMQLNQYSINSINYKYNDANR